MNKPLTVLLACLVPLSACLVAPPETPVSDAGTPLDAGTPSDAGARLDGGAAPDTNEGTTVLDDFTGFSATLLPDGDVLVVGGQRDGGTLNDARLYHPDTGRWTATAPLHEGRSQHTSFLLPTGEVLVLGGRRVTPAKGSVSAPPSTEDLQVMELYAPASGHWSRSAPMPEPRAGAQMTLLRNGQVLVTGGTLAGRITERVELYDPLLDQWTTGVPMLMPRTGHSVLEMPDGKVLVAGGQSKGSPTHAEVFDPATQTWSFTQAMNHHHQNLFAIPRLDGQVLFIEDDYVHASGRSERFDPTNHSWIEVRFPWAARHPGRYAARTFLSYGRVLYAGGASDQGRESGRTSWVTEYDAQANTWTRRAPMPEARVDHVSVLLPNGKILMLGGQTPVVSAPRLFVATYNPLTDA